MYKIKLQRKGRKRVYHYLVVAVDARKKSNTGLAKKIGYYDPTKSLFVIDYIKYDELIKNGTQPTERIVKLVKQHRA